MCIYIYIYMFKCYLNNCVMASTQARSATCCRCSALAEILAKPCIRPCLGGSGTCFVCFPKARTSSRSERVPHSSLAIRVRCVKSHDAAARAVCKVVLGLCCHVLKDCHASQRLRSFELNSAAAASIFLSRVVCCSDDLA